VRALRANELTRSIPIMAVTSSRRRRTSSVIFARPAPGQHYLSKNRVQVDTLLAKVLRAGGQGARRSE
jgi:CheY-like chemotaxis protein